MDNELKIKKFVFEKEDTNWNPFGSSAFLSGKLKYLEVPKNGSLPNKRQKDFLNKAMTLCIEYLKCSVGQESDSNKIQIIYGYCVQGLPQYVVGVAFSIFSHYTKENALLLLISSYASKGRSVMVDSLLGDLWHIGPSQKARGLNIAIRSLSLDCPEYKEKKLNWKNQIIDLSRRHDLDSRALLATVEACILENDLQSAKEVLEKMHDSDERTWAEIILCEGFLRSDSALVAKKQLEHLLEKNLGIEHRQQLEALGMLVVGLEAEELLAKYQSYEIKLRSGIEKGQKIFNNVDFDSGKSLFDITNIGISNVSVIEIISKWNNTSRQKSKFLMDCIELAEPKVKLEILLAAEKVVLDANSKTSSTASEILNIAIDLNIKEFLDLKLETLFNADPVVWRAYFWIQKFGRLKWCDLQESLFSLVKTYCIKKQEITKGFERDLYFDFAKIAFEMSDINLAKQLISDGLNKIKKEDVLLQRKYLEEACIISSEYGQFETLFESLNLLFKQYCPLTNATRSLDDIISKIYLTLSVFIQKQCDGISSKDNLDSNLLTAFLLDSNEFTLEESGPSDCMERNSKFIYKDFQGTVHIELFNPFYYKNKPIFLNVAPNSLPPVYLSGFELDIYWDDFLSIDEDSVLNPNFRLRIILRILEKIAKRSSIFQVNIQIAAKFKNQYFPEEINAVEILSILMSSLGYKKVDTLQDEMLTWNRKL